MVFIKLLPQLRLEPYTSSLQADTLIITPWDTGYTQYYSVDVSHHILSC